MEVLPISNEKYINDEGKFFWCSLVNIAIRVNKLFLFIIPVYLTIKRLFLCVLVAKTLFFLYLLNQGSNKLLYSKRLIKLNKLVSVD